MRPFLLFPIFLFLNYSASGQMPTLRYLEKKKIADSLFSAGKYQECLEKFTEIEKFDVVTQRDLYRMAFSYYVLKNDAKVEQYLREINRRGILYSLTDQIDNDYLLNQDRVYLREIKGLLRNKCIDNLPVKNKPLFDSLESRIVLDQKYRTFDQSKYSSIQKDSIWKIQVQLDVFNQRWLDSIVRVSGWPSYTEVGYKGDQYAWVIVQHADNDVDFQLKLLNTLLEQAKLNNSNSQNLAYLTDRILVNQGKKQIYGTQFNMERTETNITLTPKELEYPALVNALRDFAGLDTLESYLLNSTNRMKKKYGMAK